MEVQEYRGIRGVVGAEVLKDDKNEITFGTPFEVIPVAELNKTTETSSETHYYDNVPASVIDSTGSDEVTISGAVIPFDVLAKITGQYYDATKGMFVEGERTPKYFALGYITEKTDGTEVYVWRLKGKFNVPDDSHKTKDDGTDASGQELTFTGINTNHKFTATGNTAKAINVDQGINPQSESVFFATVQTPDTVEATCEVTFEPTPTNANIVVKKSGTVVKADAQGKYHLGAGSYTYTASATGYTTQTDVALTISASDVTTGTKEVTVTLVQTV